MMNLAMNCAVTMLGLAAACSVAVAQTPSNPPPPKPVMLKPGKPLEKCIMLKTGQRVEYRFESTAKVNFNLNYNKGDTLYYPVKLDRTTGESGMYEARARDKHCFVWENRTDTEVELTYSYKVAK